MPTQFLTLCFDSALEQEVRGVQDSLRGLPGVAVQEHRPHVTLAAFDVADARLDERLSAFLRRREGFPIRLRHIGVFPEASVVFLAPRPLAPLVELHRSLLDEFSAPGDPPVAFENLLVESWMPHCTIATVETGRLGEVVQALQEKWAPLEGAAEGIGVLVPPAIEDRLQLPFGRLVEKAFAYITRGDELLVFRQPAAPEAGIQVPAGTIGPGESPEAAALREAREETGLVGLTVAAKLGVRDFDMSPFGRAELHRRHFFHLRAAADPPRTWRHQERDRSDGVRTPVTFEFFWVRLPDEVPDLIAGHGAFVDYFAEGGLT